MEIDKTRGLVSLEESNERFASQGLEEKMIMEISKYIFLFADSLASKRRELGLSQRDIADATGLKQPAVARFERMEVIPRLDTIVRYMAAVGATIEIKFKDLPTEERSLSKTVAK